MQQEPPLLQLQKKNPTPEISAQPSKAIEQLIDLMEKGEKYKSPFLSHLDLATELSITEGHLSQLANKELNKSITQFINEYRISEAKKLLRTRLLINSPLKPLI